MHNKTKVTKDPDRRELTVERTFRVSPQLAWKGWTLPEHMERWWGPPGWTAVVHEMDVRVGGIWRYSLSPEDKNAGDTVRCIATYNEVTAPSKLVYTDTFANASWNVVEGSDMLTTVGFEPIPTGTRLKIVTHFASVKQLDSAETMGMVEGYQGTLERLEAYLETYLKHT